MIYVAGCMGLCVLCGNNSTDVVREVEGAR